jgi:D-serine deaminase-like pyridoxal phosphate-dependent protein
LLNRQEESMLKDELDTPSLLVDLNKLARNIADMADFAAKTDVGLRPHAKTHKTSEIARMQLEAGATGLTVAKLSEAEVFADAGCTDLLIAYPLVGPLKHRRLFELLERARITTVLDHPDLAAELSRAALEVGRELPVLVDVDTGMHRTGVLAGQPAAEFALQVARLPGLRFAGLLTHEGHAIMAGTPEQVRETSLAAGNAMVETAESIRAAGLEVPVVSVGLTVAAKITATVPGITETRPGTYVFYDRSSVLHGMVLWEQCAATVLATVVSRPAPDRVLLDAGSKTLTSDLTLVRPPVPGYGHVVEHPDWLIEKLSEEHGWVTIPPADPVRIGERVEIIPNHICPVVNLFDEMTLVRGDEVVGCWTVTARGKKQ